MLQSHVLVLSVLVIALYISTVDFRSPLTPKLSHWQKLISKAGSFPFLSISVPLFELIAEYEGEPMTKFSKYQANKKSTDDGVQKDLTHIFGGAKTFPCTPTPPSRQKYNHKQNTAMPAYYKHKISLPNKLAVPPYFNNRARVQIEYRSTCPRPSLFG